jgi:hypothetical protein
MAYAHSTIDVLWTEQRVHSALENRALSPWLKDALRSALEREPVELANDLELLSLLLRPWCEARMVPASPTRRTA